MNYLFAKTSNQKHDIKIFITDYGATSHMLNSEDNMTNLNNAETGVTIGDSRTFTGKNVVIGTSIINVTENSII